MLCPDLNVVVFVIALGDADKNAAAGHPVNAKNAKSAFCDGTAAERRSENTSPKRLSFTMTQ